jgi:hypothetical protein
LTRLLDSNDPPNKSAAYNKTVHAPGYIMGDDKNKANESSETMSQDIQNDVITLFGSS